MKNQSTDSFTCSPPRKSLVKGERFVRDEGKPEVTRMESPEYYVEREAKILVGRL